MAPANTGRDKSNNTTVIKIDHTNKGIRLKVIAADRMFIMVVIKFTAPKILDTPARCSEKIVRSTEGDACERLPARGG